MDSLNQKKRIIYLSLAGIVLLIGAYFVWRLFIRSSTPTQPTGQPPINGSVPGFPQGGGGATTPNGTGTSTPPITTLPPEAQKLLQLTDYAIIGPSLNKDETRVLFYKKDGGGLYAIDFDAKATDKISPVTIIGLLEATWSRNRDRSTVEYLDGDTLKSFLHIGTSSVAVLPPNTYSPTWSPDGKSLAYLIARDNLTNLIITDASGKNPRTVFSTPLPDASITWIAPQKIEFLTAPSGLAEGFSLVYTLGSGSLSQALGPFYGLATLWSPDGSKVLASFTDRTGRNPRLSIFGATGKELRRLSPHTLSDKCAWSPDGGDIYCAVPRRPPTGDAVWPDDYLRGEFESTDRVVDINTDTKEVAPVLDEGAFSLSNLFVTKDKAILFFVNRIDGTLWRYKLKE